MRGKWIFLLLALVVPLILVACGGAAAEPALTPEPIVPTHFVCYQQGNTVVDVQTIDGAKVEWVSDAATRAWVWDDSEGHHYITVSDTLTCSQSDLPQ